MVIHSNRDSIIREIIKVIEYYKMVGHRIREIII